MSDFLDGIDADFAAADNRIHKLEEENQRLRERVGELEKVARELLDELPLYWNDGLGVMAGETEEWKRLDVLLTSAEPEEPPNA